MLHTIHTQYYKSPLGNLILGSYNNQLVLCDWQYRAKREAINQRICKKLQTVFKEVKTDEVIEETIIQLKEYFSYKRTVFNLPINTIGTPFQQKVWLSLLTVPYGTTSTYLQQAIKLQNKEAIRAVATANGTNALAIIVPCHRIIGNDGSLVGYAGGLLVKQKLLKIEGIISKKQNPKQLTLSF